MKYTNKYCLPDAFVRAVINDPYSKGASDYSATGLAVPARATALIAAHGDEIEVDVTSRVAAIIGQGAHSVAERAARPDDMCEERLFAEFIINDKTYIVSAQLDLYERDTHTMYDWKTTKAYAFSKKAGGGQKPEWQTQMNVGAEILRRNKHTPKALKIIAMLKDFNLRDTGKDGYPRTEVVEVDIDIWSSEKVTAYVTNRILAHELAKVSLPECTSAETWYGRRCQGGWCDASSVCSQWKTAQVTGIIQQQT